MRVCSAMMCAALLILSAPMSASAQQAYDSFANPTNPYDDTFRQAIPDERTYSLRPDNYDGLRPGFGREDTYYAFADCNLISTIKGSAKSRGGWIKFLDANAGKCKLTDLSMEERDVILDYLTASYGY